MNKLPATLAAITIVLAPAHAHEGHGLPGLAHWHATDAAMFIAGVAVLALAWWAGRK